MMKKYHRDRKQENIAITDPEILRYKANRIELIEMQIQGSGRMQFNTGTRESFSGSWSNSSQRDPEARETSNSEATGPKTRSWLWDNSLEVPALL